MILQQLVKAIVKATRQDVDSKISNLNLSQFVKLSEIDSKIESKMSQAPQPQSFEEYAAAELGLSNTQIDDSSLQAAMEQLINNAVDEMNGRQPYRADILFNPIPSDREGFPMLGNLNGSNYYYTLTGVGLDGVEVVHWHTVTNLSQAYINSELKGTGRLGIKVTIFKEINGTYTAVYEDIVFVLNVAPSQQQYGMTGTVNYSCRIGSSFDQN